MKIIQNYSLLKHNTFGLNLKTRWFVEYESEADLQKLLHDEFFFSQRFWHIGEGSNLLFLSDFDGIIVHSGIKGIEIIKEDENSVWLKVGAAENWDEFVSYCITNNWAGIENLSLIPGEVGAGALQNIGAYGVEAADRIEEVHAYYLKTGEKRIFTNAECEYAYRHSFFKKTENRGLYYITQVVYRLSKQPIFLLDYGNLRQELEGKEINLQTVRDAVIAIRQSKLPDPKIEGNAGSFFMNPYLPKTQYENLKKQYPDLPHYPVNEEQVKIPAAWLIDRCGLKGKTVGGAAIHEKQALVIVNRNQATGKDILALAEEVQAAVKTQFSIDLQTEVNYI